MGTVTQFACAACGKVLKSPKPIEQGTRIKCPKCAQTFVVGPAAASRRTVADVKPGATRRPSRIEKRKRSNPVVMWATCFVVSLFFTLLIWVPCSIAIRMAQSAAQNSSKDPFKNLDSLKDTDFGKNLDRFKDSGTAVKDSGKGTKGETPPPGEDGAIASEALFQEYRADPAATRKKYQGKSVTVRGIVTGCGLNLGEPVIQLQGDKGISDNVVGSPKEDREPWAKIAPGQIVTIRGTLSPLPLPGPYLDDCMVVDYGTFNATRLSAEDLAREYATGAAAVTDKYKGKHLVIEGVIVKEEKGRTSRALGTTSGKVWLKGTDGVNVRCEFDGVKDWTPLQTGNSLKAMTTFGKQSMPNEVSLENCRLITQ